MTRCICPRSCACPTLGSAGSCPAPRARAEFRAILLFVYGFIIFTGSPVLHRTRRSCRIFPHGSGFNNYVRLFNHPNWITSLKNLAIFATLYIVICSVPGARACDPARPENPRRGRAAADLPLSRWRSPSSSPASPGSGSSIPASGLNIVMRSWGWESFSFRWIKEGKMAIYTVVIAAIWQSSGFVMAMFLAGLRGVDNEIIKAAQIDGASNWTLYRRIIIPLMRPVFLSAFVVLAHLAIKSYDLIVAMTSGGPGTATWTPALFMQNFTFTRNEMGMGASSAIIMLMMIFAIIVPYLYSELDQGQRR